MMFDRSAICSEGEMAKYIGNILCIAITFSEETEKDEILQIIREKSINHDVTQL